MPSPVHLVPSDEPPLFVLVVEQLFIGIECFLVPFLGFGPVLVLAVEHADVAIVHDVSEYADTGIPFEVFVNRSFDVAGNTDEVTFVFIEHARTIVFVSGHFGGVFFPVMPREVILRLVAVESVEVAHSVRQIGGIECESVTRDEVLGVVVEAEDAVVLGGISGFEVE